jgi:DNA-binding NarL/FixJ family response regulator
MTEDHGLILLVDDEPWFSEALAVTLESLGFECITAVDATGGIAILKDRSVKVVVSDIMMPAGSDFSHADSDETGFRFIDYVRRHWPAIPIVCLSVIGDQRKIHSLADRGVRYLRKGETPLSTAVEVIRSVAAGRRIRL